MLSRSWIRCVFPECRDGLVSAAVWLLEDNGYDAVHLRQYCDHYRMQPVIPQLTMKRKPKPGLPRLFDRPKYRQRNIIERMFGWLKEYRRIGARQKFLRDGNAGLHVAMPTAVLFVQRLRTKD